MAQRKLSRELRIVVELGELADAERACQQFEASPRDGLSFIELLGGIADLSTVAAPPSRACKRRPFGRSCVRSGLTASQAGNRPTYGSNSPVCFRFDLLGIAKSVTYNPRGKCGATAKARSGKQAATLREGRVAAPGCGGLPWC